MALLKTHSDHHTTAKSVISLLVVLLGFALFMIFYNNQETLTSPTVFPTFMTLAVITGGLLITLVYLVNNSHHKPAKAVKSVKAAPKKAAKSSKKKRK